MAEFAGKRLVITDAAAKAWMPTFVGMTSSARQIAIYPPSTL